METVEAYILRSQNSKIADYHALPNDPTAARGASDQSLCVSHGCGFLNPEE
jgi:hypothetical protein